MPVKVLSYGFSLAGRSHAASGTLCQDSHILRPLAGGWTLAAVADGVGSAPCSDQGSQMAVHALAAFCSDRFRDNMRTDTLPQLLREGFGAALQAVTDIAREAEQPLADYDTTLTAVLYDGARVVVGHCGDGGVIGMDGEGRYHLLTHPHKGDAWNEVFPLRSGEPNWDFFAHEGAFAGLLLLTDGVLDVAVPPLLRTEEHPIYNAFVHQFLGTEMAKLSPDDFRGLAERGSAYIESEACAAITDDATAVALVNGDAAIQPPSAEYLAEPDWEGLRLARYYKLYPHLKPQGEEEAPNDGGLQAESVQDS